MPRPEKVQAVAEIKERIEGAQAVFLAEYAGLSVKDQQALRRSLRESGAEFKVVKMTLARRATDALDIDSLDELLWGPTGLTFADGDPVGVAKVLKDFSKEHSVFQVKGGLLGSDFLTPEKIAELAEIEPREVLLAKLAGAMKAPMANMAALLAALPRNTASVLQQLLEKKEAAAPAEAAPEATVEDASVDEAPKADAGAPDDEAADEVPAVEDGADVAPESEAATDGDAAETETTEEDSEPTVEASDDADDETETPADEASDDAEEE